MKKFRCPECGNSIVDNNTSDEIVNGEYVVCHACNKAFVINVSRPTMGACVCGSKEWIRYEGDDEFVCVHCEEPRCQ